MRAPSRLSRRFVTGVRVTAAWMAGVDRMPWRTFRTACLASPHLANLWRLNGVSARPPQRFAGGRTAERGSAVRRAW